MWILATISATTDNVWFVVLAPRKASEFSDNGKFYDLRRHALLEKQSQWNIRTL